MTATPDIRSMVASAIHAEAKRIADETAYDQSALNWVGNRRDQLAEAAMRTALLPIVEALEWANDRLRECGKQVDFSLGMCRTLTESERRATEIRQAIATEPHQ